MAVRVGVIGAGLMGSTHVRLLSDRVAGAEVAAVSDALPGQAERVAAECGVTVVHGDGSELIRDPGVDAVVVASPAATHVAFVRACLDAGKPVLCEKPLAETAEACRQLVDAELAAGRRLVQVGFMRRYDPGFADLKLRLDAGLVGSPVLVRCVHRNAAVSEGYSSDMLITESVVHEIDVARWLLGEELARVTVHAPRPTSVAPEGVRDPQLVVLESETGVLIDVEIFVNARYGYDIRCEVVGEAGTLSLAPPVTVEVRRDGRHEADVPSFYRDRFTAAYVEELRVWAASVADGQPGGPSAWDGYAAAAVCEAGVAALQGAGGPVDVVLGPRPDLYAEPGELIGHR
jgi:myo-inositol 2-dehydrogenase / D-chiro-inositol 1-dehydrogenase